MYLIVFLDASVATTKKKQNENEGKLAGFENELFLDCVGLIFFHFFSSYLILLRTSLFSLVLSVRLYSSTFKTDNKDKAIIVLLWSLTLNEMSCHLAEATLCCVWYLIHCLRVFSFS
jgi:hypothetical protein